MYPRHLKNFKVGGKETVVLTLIKSSHSPNLKKKQHWHQNKFKKHPGSIHGSINAYTIWIITIIRAFLVCHNCYEKSNIGQIFQYEGLCANSYHWKKNLWFGPWFKLCQYFSTGQVRLAQIHFTAAEYYKRQLLNRLLPHPARRQMRVLLEKKILKEKYLRKRRVSGNLSFRVLADYSTTNHNLSDLAINQ